MSTLSNLQPQCSPSIDLLSPLRQWMNSLQVRDRAFAHFLCKCIPCTCPFQRQIAVFNFILQIPPLCKLNPLYDEVISLRLRALSYLSDECGEDITLYLR